MSEHHSIDFSGKQFLDYSGGCVVRKMSVPRLDSLFYRPRTVRIILQKFFVVIGFDHERLYSSQTFHDHFRGVTEIGNETEPARAGIKREPDRIDRVVGHRKSLDSDVANLEFRAGAKNSPIRMSI